MCITCPYSLPTTAGEWVKCKKVLVKPTEEKKFLEMNDFLVDSSAPMTIVVQLDIEIEGIQLYWYNYN